MEMTFTGAWAGKQLPVVSGTEVIIGEDLIEGQSWTIGVVLLVTIGVVLLSGACIVHDSHLPTGRTVTREPEVARQPSCMTPRSMRAEIMNHVKERAGFDGTALAAYCHHERGPSQVYLQFSHLW